MNSPIKLVTMLETDQNKQMHTATQYEGMKTLADRSGIFNTIPRVHILLFSDHQHKPTHFRGTTHKLSPDQY